MQANNVLLYIKRHLLAMQRHVFQKVIHLFLFEYFFVFPIPCKRCRILRHLSLTYVRQSFYAQ